MRLLVPLVVALALVSACGGGGSRGDGAIDGGVDGSETHDSGSDSSGLVDSGFDGGSDAGRDAAGDSGRPDGGACDPANMPQPNAGMFTEGLGHPDCHLGTVMVDTFCMDRHEATLAVVAADGSLTSWSPFFSPDGVRVRALSVEGTVPQGHITREQAAGACAEAGKRLCTDAEWLRACRGPDEFTYPYGDAREEGRCNDARAVHPAVEYFGVADDWVWSMLGHPCLNQLPDSLGRTGDYPGCQSADGVYDLMGNLQEWTGEASGTLRGGSYVDTRINGEGCLYRTTADGPSHGDFATGFRCCADPE